MAERAFDSAVNLVAAMRAGDASSRELTDYYIDRIERLDGEVNSVIVRDFERAREAADAADAARAEGRDLGPLHGLPMTIKEAYDVEGLPTTWGIPEMKDNVATSDAESVRRLKAAGAHFMGKTNVPLSLADFQSFNEIYGTTRNPWDLERTPGGSSGGSSAALAAGLTGLEAGSDIGGSIRNPAHFCGIYGHKPTWGVVPDQGHSLPGMLAPADIAVVGPMARSAEDLAVSMDIVAGADEHNAAGWTLTLPRPTKTKLSDYRVAVWADDERSPVSRDVADRVQEVADTLARCGATVSDTARPAIDFDASLDTYEHLLWGVMAAGDPDELREAKREMLAAMPEDDRSLAANAMRYSLMDHREWAQSHNARFGLRAAWRAFFEEWDILICPQMPTTAFPHDHTGYFERTITIDNEPHEYFQQIFWAGTITVGHLPSTCFPTGPARDGLPVGLQAVGSEFQDYQTIDFSRLLTQEIGGFTPPPDFAGE